MATPFEWTVGETARVPDAVLLGYVAPALEQIDAYHVWEGICRYRPQLLPVVLIFCSLLQPYLAIS